MIRRLIPFLLILAACAREQPRYNVLFITLDTTRADHIGCYGGRAPTPTIDRIAKGGVRFADADSPVPLTLPAHGTLLSGLLPLHHGVRNNGAGVFASDRPTLATVLSGRGYRTGAFVGSFVLDHRFGLNRGFDVYDDAVERDVEGRSDSEAERRADLVIDAALQWLGREDARPYFAWLHLYDPHAPYTPPKPYEQGYDGEIAYVDAQLARVLGKIDRTKTVIAIVGDHGESLGDHGELQHGLLLYESTLRVPLIIAAPSLEPQVIAQPVSTVDLAPTIAGLLGTSMGAVDGRDLFRERGQRDIYAETQYPLMFGWSELVSIRRGNTKLIAGEMQELFDLRKGEQENALANERRAFRDLSARLEAIRATAVKPQAVNIDEETKAKLASLGYVAPVAATSSSAGRDPRAMTRLFRDWEMASAALSENRPEQAAQLGERLVHDDPPNRVFRSTLAHAYRRLGKMDRAIRLYREAVALAPNDPDAWYDLAAALQESGNAAEAAVVIDEALKHDPNRAEGHNMRGVAVAASNPSAALDEFRKTIALDPRNARAYCNLGNALRSLGRYEEAADAYRKTIELAPRYADPLNGLGVLLVQRGRGDEALRLFDAALAISPDFYEARLNRAIASEVSGDRSGAIRQLTELLAAMPPGRHEPVRRAASDLLRQLRR